MVCQLLVSVATGSKSATSASGGAGEESVMQALVQGTLAITRQVAGWFQKLHRIVHEISSL